jgi:hypothetical protein
MEKKGLYASDGTYELGVESWKMMRLKKPVLFINGPGWGRKLASFNSWAEAEIFMEYLKHGLHAAGQMANPTNQQKAD